MKRTFVILFTLGLLLVLSNSSWANDSSANLSKKELAKQNRQLLKRVEKLESELTEIKNMIKKNVSSEKKCHCKSIKKNVVTSKYGMDLYGYIKFDAAYDTNRVKYGNTALWVESQAVKDSEFNETANQTRLGLKLNGPDFHGGKTSGRFEMDFYGGGPENKANPRLRLAYMKLYWPKSDFYILAGQDWDIISPLSPTTLNFPVAWMAGNLGMRHPQISMYKGIKIGKDRKLKIKAGLSRTIGDSNQFSSIMDSGEDSGQPTFQGRVGYSFPGINGMKTEIGISGSFGKEEYDINNNGGSYYFNSHSLIYDLKLPVTRRISFKGEFFRAMNMDNYAGGIGQGILITDLTGKTYINTSSPTAGYLKGQEIESHGGWGQFTFNPYNKFKYNLGLSMDKLDLNNLIYPTGTRMKNAMGWVNAYYQINENTTFGLEFMRLFTEYNKAPNGDAHRVQSSLIFKF